MTTITTNIHVDDETEFKPKVGKMTLGRWATLRVGRGAVADATIFFTDIEQVHSLILALEQLDREWAEQDEADRLADEAQPVA
jgi:hypothetical protein